jgi:hypothetical protein
MIGGLAGHLAPGRFRPGTRRRHTNRPGTDRRRCSPSLAYRRHPTGQTQRPVGMPQTGPSVVVTSVSGAHVTACAAPLAEELACAAEAVPSASQDTAAAIVSRRRILLLGGAVMGDTLLVMWWSDWGTKRWPVAVGHHSSSARQRSSGSDDRHRPPRAKSSRWQEPAFVRDDVIDPPERRRAQRPRLSRNRPRSSLSGSRRQQEDERCGHREHAGVVVEGVAQRECGGVPSQQAEEDDAKYGDAH